MAGVFAIAGSLHPSGPPYTTTQAQLGHSRPPRPRRPSKGSKRQPSRRPPIDSKPRRGRRGKTKSSKQESLFKQVAKAVRQLGADPRHNSLNTHEYDSLPNPVNPGEKVFEAYAQNSTPGAYRVFWCYGPERGEITIIAITPHP